MEMEPKIDDQQQTKTDRQFDKIGIRYNFSDVYSVAKSVLTEFLLWLVHTSHSRGILEENTSFLG